MSRYVRVFDTTLRDGEQAPGCSMTLGQKIAVARQLARLRVDIIEAGFPASSPGEAEAVAAVAEAVGTGDGPVICGLARANPRDIDCCANSVARAARSRIHIFLATSDIHIEHKLRLTRERVLALAAESVAYAVTLCDDVEFSAEDATRSDPAFLSEVFSAAYSAGAKTLNIPDTVGYRTPGEYESLIRLVASAVNGGDDVVFSAHCHDDLGLAVANSLAAVQAGARQVECTINGIGERAGNASLEEIVMALHTRRDLFGLEIGVQTEELLPSSRLLSQTINIPVPPNKAIVGANAFAHEAGIHQDGVLKNPLTYEIMSAATVGRTSELVLGKHSGRNALRARVASDFQLELGDAELHVLFGAFKTLADRSHRVSSEDLWQLIETELGVQPRASAPVDSESKVAPQSLEQRS